MNRRKVMLGGAAVVGATTVAGLTLPEYSGAVRGLVEDIVARHLPGVRLEREGLRQFSADKLAEIDHNANYKIYAACRLFGLDVASLSDAARAKIEAFERETLSDFLLGSDFFSVGDPRAQSVAYRSDGSTACRNPFAVFD
jgi:hypothetical protein